MSKKVSYRIVKLKITSDDRQWCKELEVSKLKGKQPSLSKAVIKAFVWQYIFANLIIIFGEVVLRLAQPFLVGFVIRYLSSEGKDVDPTIARVSAGLLVITTTLYCSTRHRANVLATRVGNNVRSALSVLLFKKVLRLSASSLEKTDVGQIINIMANDLNRFEELSWSLIFFLLGPFMCILVVYITYVYLNWAACIAGLAMILLFIAFQGLMGRLFNVFRRRTTSITDKRVNTMSELIAAMKIIKVYCWEDPFAAVVSDIREKEIASLKRTYHLKGINSSLFFIATRAMLFAAFMTYVLMGNTLTAEAVFVTLALYDAIRLPVTNFFPAAIGTGAEALISINRIQKILLLPEKANDDEIEEMHESKIFFDGNPKEKNGRNYSHQDSISSLLTPGLITIRNYCAKWNNLLELDNLHNINIDIRPGELAVVVGSVGSGKTCFLQALLNEIEKTSGSCILSGKSSYAPQESWCFGATVKQNILLNNPYDEDKFSHVVKVCGLERDISLFPDGEETFVGEKGYSLSGGQKARVSLARAVYHDADVYLLDDPLSAVDPKVANHIFEQCVKGFLKHKTVVLVTHQLQFLSKGVDKVILMKEGYVDGIGSYEKLLTSSPYFKSLLSLREDEDKKKTGSVSKNSENPMLQRNNSINRRHNSFSLSLHSTVESSADGDDVAIEDGIPSAKLNDKDYGEEEPKKQTVSRDEYRGVGAVDPKLYWQYLAFSGRPFMIFVAFACAAIAQGLFQFNDSWLSAWTEKRNSSEDNPALAAAFVVQNDNINMGIYTLLLVLLFIFGLSKTIFTFLVCLASSIKLHDTVFKRLLRAPISFYETNPLGRILNRVTRDVGVIDQVVPATFADFSSVFFNVFGVLVLSIVLNPWLLIPCFVIGCLSVPSRNYYLKTARGLQRLDSIARSPVYDHISSAFSGLIAVRSFRLQDCFERQFLRYMKDSVSARFLTFSCQRAVGFAMDFLSNVYIAAIILAIMLSPKGTIPGGDAGLILSASLQILGWFQYCIRMSADFETQMVSCERVMEYGKLEPEAELKSTPGNRPPPNWPTAGGLSFENVFLWYNRSLPPVLRGVSFDVFPQEKIGIVGRTGAGKSSLVSVLFRLVEPEGCITIDGIEISKLGLHDVRGKISIIPQDPVLFSGTIRNNLDPFNQYPDDKLWESLQESNLAVAVQSMPGNLDANITEGGSNLSVGQRQLLCLARALLKKNRILVCDEATANVDLETDELIQKTIKSKFQDCTVLTVAHRLNTIIDMDKILVMDAGQVVEFDEPHILLKNPQGVFYSMVKETNPSYEKKLHRLAEHAYFKRHRIAEDSEARRFEVEEENIDDNEVLEREKDC